MPFINYRIFLAISYSGVTSPLVSILSPFRIRNRCVLDSFILIFTSFNFPLYFFHLFFSLYCILCYFSQPYLQVTLILPFCIFSYLTHSLEFFLCLNDFVFNFYYYYWFFKKSACFPSCLTFLPTAYFFFYASKSIDSRHRCRQLFGNHFPIFISSNLFENNLVYFTFWLDLW